MRSKKVNQKFKWMSCLAMCMSVLTACSAAPSSSSDSQGNTIGESVLIGYNLELSGNVAAYGQVEKNGADLAVEEINASGGIDGKMIDIVSQDNKSDSTEAATVATNLATEKGVVAMIGPATSAPVAAATPNATSAGVPIVTPSATQDSLTISTFGEVNEYIFRVTFQDSFQGQVLSKYVTDNLSAQRVVLYYDASSDYAKGIADTFKEFYQGEIVAEETFQASDTDFQAALTQIMNLEFDAIVMPGYYTETGLITKQVREMGIDQPIVGPDGFADSKFIASAGAANTNNVYYISGYSTQVNLSTKSAAFIEAYTEKYGEEPNMFAALAYDAVYMIAHAAQGASTSKDVTNNLAKLTDFEGVTGVMTIDDKHNPIKPAIMIGLENGQQVSAEVIEVDEE